MSVPKLAAEPGSGPPVAAPAPAGDGPFHIPSLDGIRAASFMTVFLAHAGLGFIVPGYFGLTLFFFLSGYLITTLLRLEFDRTGDVSLRHFYLRRVLRIFPPFYLVLGLATVLSLTGVLGGSVSLGGILAQTLHATNYYVIRNGWWEGMAPGTWVYWSLAVEEHFYLGFPVLYLWLRRRGFTRRRQVAILLGICGLVLAWRCCLVFLLHAAKDRTYVASDTRVDSILAGCILAVWNNPVIDAPTIDDRRLVRVWLPLGLASVLVSLAVRVPSFEQSFRYTLQSFGLLPLFVVAIRFHDRHIFRVLNLRPVRYLGLLSYSLYLMHTSVLWLFEYRTRLPTPVRSTLVFALLIVLGTLIYRYVERPCGKIRRRLASYLDRRSRSRSPLAA